MRGCEQKREREREKRLSDSCNSYGQYRDTIDIRSGADHANEFDLSQAAIASKRNRPNKNERCRFYRELLRDDSIECIFMIA